MCGIASHQHFPPSVGPLHGLPCLHLELQRLGGLDHRRRDERRSPQWAAQQALVNASRSTSLSNVVAAIYSFAGAAYAADFFDITSGSNGGYSAGTGYDYVTGLGSTDSPNLVPALIKK